jgi:hypothetical protein
VPLPALALALTLPEGRRPAGAHGPARQREARPLTVG